MKTSYLLFLLLLVVPVAAQTANFGDYPEASLPGVLEGDVMMPEVGPIQPSESAFATKAVSNTCSSCVAPVVVTPNVAEVAVEAAPTPTCCPTQPKCACKSRKNCRCKHRTRHCGLLGCKRKSDCEPAGYVGDCGDCCPETPACGCSSEAIVEATPASTGDDCCPSSAPVDGASSAVGHGYHSATVRGYGGGYGVSGFGFGGLGGWGLGYAGVGGGGGGGGGGRAGLTFGALGLRNANRGFGAGGFLGIPIASPFQ